MEEIWDISKSKSKDNIQRDPPDHSESVTSFSRWDGTDWATTPDAHILYQSEWQKEKKAAAGGNLYEILIRARCWEVTDHGVFQVLFDKLV